MPTTPKRYRCLRCLLVDALVYEVAEKVCDQLEGNGYDGPRTLNVRAKGGLVVGL